MAEYVDMDHSLVIECDEYIINARLKLAAIMEQTGTDEIALQKEGNAVRSAKAVERPREATITKDEPRAKNTSRPREVSKTKEGAKAREAKRHSKAGTEKRNSKSYEREPNRLSTYSYASNKTAFSIRSAPPAPRRFKECPKLSQDKSHRAAPKTKLRLHSNDSQLKERLDRMPLDAGIRVRPQERSSRPSTASSNSRQQTTRHQRGGLSQSSNDAESCPPTPELSDGSWRGSESGASFIESPPTPPPISSVPVSKEGLYILPPKNPARYTPGSKDLQSTKSRSVPNPTVPRYDRISCPTYDYTSILSASWTGSQMYENPRDSVPIPIDQSNLESIKVHGVDVPPVPPIPPILRPGHQRDGEKMTVQPSYSYFDDSSDYDEELSDIDERVEIPTQESPESENSHQDLGTDSKPTREESPTLANGYAHIKDGTVQHSPAYMRVSPDAAIKARKALQKKQQEEEGVKNRGFFNKLSSFFSSKPSANKGRKD